MPTKSNRIIVTDGRSHERDRAVRRAEAQSEAFVARGGRIPAPLQG
jgi:hypothetical protein